MFVLLEFLIFLWIFKLFFKPVKEILFGIFLIFVSYFLMMWARENDFYSNCTDFCGVEQVLVIPILLILVIIALVVGLVREKKKEKNMTLKETKSSE